METNHPRYASTGRDVEPRRRVGRHDLPELLTIDEAADLLRTTRRAIYAMVGRRQLPGVIRIRRRLLLRADELARWLNARQAGEPRL